MSSTLSCRCTARTLVTSAGILRYHEAGYGPPLVLLHGLTPATTGPSDFRTTLPAFAEFFRCLLLELPTFGVSDDGGGDPMLAGRDALIRFIEALGLESIGIIGNSIGGGIAVDYALRHPSRVHRLVTVGGLLGSDSAERAEEFTGKRARDQLVQTPTLLIWGRDDRVTPLDMALTTMSGFANGQLHVFPNCGHWPMIEQQEAFENVVLSFLLQRDPPESLSGTAGFPLSPGMGSSTATAVGGGCTVRPAVQYVMGQ